MRPTSPFTPFEPAPAGAAIHAALARGTAPRERLKVSEWADRDRVLSTKTSAHPGRWHTATNPMLREPMDCFSLGSNVHDVVCMWPIQKGKSEIGLNVIGYCMVENPGPLMVALPGEVSMNKWVAQKLHPMIEESPAIRATLTSVASREAANTRTFKDFAGGQLYIEHAGSPARLKSTTVRTLVVDEFDEVAANFPAGDDPGEMLDGRTSASPATYQRLYISSPQTKGASRTEAKWLASDQRRYFVACPHCGHRQHLQWEGLKWSEPGPDGRRQAWYVCAECATLIEEHHKPAMLAGGRWVATNPGPRMRGYHCNCLYYDIGLGPRWADLVEMWLAAQGDPAKLKTFRNDRLAETHEDETTAKVKHELIQDRAEGYALRTAPMGVLCITAGIDTQDNRLAVQLVGWGRRQAFWVLDYIELPGDPAGDEVWHALTALLTAPIQHESGATLRVEAMAQDAAGHRTEDVKAYIRRARSLGVRRPLCTFGAVPNNAPVLKAGNEVDINWRGRNEKGGMRIHHVGTVECKKWLFSRLSQDATQDDKHHQAVAAEEAASRTEGRSTKPIAPPLRLCHFTSALEDRYFPGLTSEVFDPVKNRYVKKRGVRNEPLDTWVYAFAATYHPELRLHRATEADWSRREADLRARAGLAADAIVITETPAPAAAPAPAAPQADQPDGTPVADPAAILKQMLRGRASSRAGGPHVR